MEIDVARVRARLPNLDISSQKTRFLLLGALGVVLCLSSILAVFAYASYLRLQESSRSQSAELSLTKEERNELEQRLLEVLAEDQLLRNERLEATISAIQETYQQAVKSYENLVDLGDPSLGDADEQFAEILNHLSERRYASAQASLLLLDRTIQAEQARLVAATILPNLESLPAVSTPPDSGYRRQAVDTSIGRYQVSIVTADLNSTRVIVDTASDGDCFDNCPVQSLATYVARSGAFAGVNGSYFCPASYPSCAGKTNTFDTLLMNKNKVYFNSDNNVYSNVPAVIFSGSSARFVGRSLEWGRDTGVDAVLANQPLLVSNGQVVFAGDGDPKKGSKGNRSFVGASGSTVYIGVVHNVTVAEAAIVLQALGMQNALNLDSGGSTALWSDGYKAGPGRDIPNALLFVRK